MPTLSNQNMTVVTERLEDTPVWKTFVFGLAAYHAAVRNNQLKNKRLLEEEEYYEYLLSLEQYKKCKAHETEQKNEDATNRKFQQTFFKNEQSETKFNTPFFFQPATRPVNKLEKIEQAVSSTGLSLPEASREYSSNQNRDETIAKINQLSFNGSIEMAAVEATPVVNGAIFKSLMLTAAMNTMTSTTKSVGQAIVYGSADKIALQTVKSLAPSLAKKLPVIGTLLSAMELGYTVFKPAPMATKMNALANLGIECVATAVGQAIIPIPVVGAFIGSVAGTGIVEFKNAFQAM